MIQNKITNLILGNVTIRSTFLALLVLQTYTTFCNYPFCKDLQFSAQTCISLEVNDELVAIRFCRSIMKSIKKNDTTVFY